MKLFRIVLSILVVLLATMSLAETGVKATFEKLKALEGSWSGKTTDGRPVQVSFRVTSGGSAIMSEIQGKEDMITMFHLDGNRLMMTHYCGAGNQPRMVGTMSPDGKTVNFDFLDATNLSAQPGHMNQMRLTMTDASHHAEDWDFLAPDGKHMHEHFDLERK